jgi:hypothetical protein
MKTRNNNTLNQLKLQHKFSDKIFKIYEFEKRSNKVFIMTKQVKQFNKIRAVRKGLLFAIKKGDKIELNANIKYILNLRIFESTVGSKHLTKRIFRVDRIIF